MPQFRTLLCWLTHSLTASGAIIGLWAIYFSVHHQFGTSLILLTLTIIIDSIDGPIARHLDIKKHIKHIDGSLLDNIVDFFTWSIVPCYLLLQKPLFSITTNILLTSGIILASSYQFCCNDAKVEDNKYFKRFPSLWSPLLIATYVSTWPSHVIITIFIVSIILSFTPIYAPKAFTKATIHSNKKCNKILQTVNNIENCVFILACAVGAFTYPSLHEWITIALSIAITVRLGLWAIATQYKYS